MNQLFFIKQQLNIEENYGKNWKEKAERVNLIDGKIRLRFANEQFGLKALKHKNLFITDSDRIKLKVASVLNREIRTIILLLDGDANPFVSRTTIGKPYINGSLASIDVRIKDCGKYFILVFIETDEKLYWGYRPMRVVFGDCVGFR